MAFIEASLEELPVSANLGQSCSATKINAPGPSSFGWFRHRSNPYPMGVSDPLPAGRVISFGSLEFRATGNGYLMQLLSPRRNLVALTPPAQRNRRSGHRSRQARAERRRAARHSSRMWVEAGMSQLSIVANGATASSSRASASSAPHLHLLQH